MKAIFTALFSLLTAIAGMVVCQAQTTVEFTYDNSGNREIRTVISLKSATIGESEDGEEYIRPLEDQVGLQKIRIYPNPTKGLLIIDFSSYAGQDATVQLFDRQGRIIIEHALSLSNEIDLSAYPSGLYIMVIWVGQDKKEWKIIKE